MRLRVGCSAPFQQSAACPFLDVLYCVSVDSTALCCMYVCCPRDGGQVGVSNTYFCLGAQAYHNMLNPRSWQEAGSGEGREGVRQGAVWQPMRFLSCRNSTVTLSHLMFFGGEYQPPVTSHGSFPPCFRVVT